MKQRTERPGLSRGWRVARNLGVVALLLAAWLGYRYVARPPAAQCFQWAQRGALMADPVPLQGEIEVEFDRYLVGAEEQNILIYREGDWELQRFPRAPGPALVPLPVPFHRTDAWIVAVDVPEGTASARLELTAMEEGWYEGAKEEGLSAFPDPAGDSGTLWFGKTYSVEGELLADGAILFSVRSGGSYAEQNLLLYTGIWEHYTSDHLPYGTPFACHMEATFYGEDGEALGRAALSTWDGPASP